MARISMTRSDTLNGAQCRAARALLRLSQKRVASMARVCERTIVDLEREVRIPHRFNQRAIRTALEQAGAVFVRSDMTGGVGVRLRT